MINPNIHKELHITAIRLDMTVTDCLEAAILDFIKKHEKEASKKKIKKSWRKTAFFDEFTCLIYRKRQKKAASSVSAKI